MRPKLILFHTQTLQLEHHHKVQELEERLLEVKAEE
jgi:hypothetical protein